jgi:hypothetical protein
VSSPTGLDICDFEFKPGWKIDFKKDDRGKIVGATWTGKIVPYEFVEFGMLGINPKEGTSLVWKFVQYHEDGSKEEFTGPVGAILLAGLERPLRDQWAWLGLNLDQGRLPGGSDDVD